MPTGPDIRSSRRQLIGAVSILGGAAVVLHVAACAPAAAPGAVPPTSAPAPASPPPTAAAPTTAPGPTTAPAPTAAPAPPTAPAPTAAPAPTVAPAATSTPAPAAAAAAGAPKRGGTISLLVHEDLTSLDPHVETSLGDTLMLPMIVEPLVAGNANDEIEPVIAESWKTDDGGKAWTFNLRKRDVGSWVKLVSTWDWDMSPSVVGTLFHPDRPYGYFASEHPERYFFAAVPGPDLDKLIVQGRNELDLTKAKATYKTIQEKYAEDQGVPQFLVNTP